MTSSPPSSTALARASALLMTPSASSLGCLPLVVGERLGTDTRNVSYLISSFMGGFTSIVRRGPCGRPLLLAKRDVVDNNGDVDVDSDVDVNDGDSVNGVDGDIDRGEFDDSGAFVWTVNAAAVPRDAVRRKARVDDKFIFILKRLIDSL